jgi:hypothetical protein
MTPGIAPFWCCCAGAQRVGIYLKYYLDGAAHVDIYNPSESIHFYSDDYNYIEHLCGESLPDISTYDVIVIQGFTAAWLEAGYGLMSSTDGALFRAWLEGDAARRLFVIADSDMPGDSYPYYWQWSNRLAGVLGLPFSYVAHYDAPTTPSWVDLTHSVNNAEVDADCPEAVVADVSAIRDYQAGEITGGTPVWNAREASSRAIISYYVTSGGVAIGCSYGAVSGSDAVYAGNIQLFDNLRHLPRSAFL